MRSGDGLRERGTRGIVEGSVVEWDGDGSNVRAGPTKSRMNRAERNVEHTSHTTPFGKCRTSA